MAILTTKTTHEFPVGANELTYITCKLRVHLTDLNFCDDQSAFVTVKFSYLDANGDSVHSLYRSKTYTVEQVDAMVAQMNLPSMPNSARIAAIKAQGLAMYIASNPTNCRERDLTIDDFE